MTGLWRQRAVSNFVSGVGWTYNISTPRRQYLVQLDGRIHGGSGTADIGLRLNSFATGTHRVGWHFSQPSASSQGENSTYTYALLAQGTVDHAFQVVARLTRHTNYYILRSEAVAIALAGGVHTFQRWSTQIPVTADLTTIEVLFDRLVSLARFTGQGSIWSTDD